MFSIRIRPRIREFTNNSIEAVIEKFRAIINSKKYPFQAKIVEHHLIIKYHHDEQEFWSPELTLEVVENPFKNDEFAEHTEHTLLRGYISPKPSIWTFFIFTYVGLGLACLSFVVYGTSQMMLDQPTNLLWYALGCVIGILAMFIASQVGQRLGDKQTEILVRMVKEALV